MPTGFPALLYPQLHLSKSPLFPQNPMKFLKGGRRKEEGHLPPPLSLTNLLHEGAPTPWISRRRRTTAATKVTHFFC
ncbi:hypothetical protein V2J09_019486 [Rumex salicifolius]